jgi:predicted Fe-Mo cluster-binding NifX family protein
MKKVITAMLMILFLVSGFAFAGEKEKIAVAANGQTPAASVGIQAGRSPFFLLFDTKGKFVEAIDNPYKTKSGAGKAVADFLAGRGVKIVVAESFGGPLLVSELPAKGVAVVVAEYSGTSMLEAMKEEGMEAVAFNGSVKEAVKKVLHSDNMKIDLLGGA